MVLRHHVSNTCILYMKMIRKVKISITNYGIWSVNEFLLLCVYVMIQKREKNRYPVVKTSEYNFTVTATISTARQKNANFHN